MPRTESTPDGSFGQALGISVTDIWKPPHDAARSGENVSFAHPVHGSTTGTNLSINLTRDVWICRRCGSGGDALLALAVDERIIDCADARSRALADPALMALVKDAARRRGFDVDKAERERWTAWQDSRISAEGEAARPSGPTAFSNLDELDLAIVRQYDPVIDRDLTGVLPGEDVASVDRELCKRLVYWHFDDSAIDQILRRYRPNERKDSSDSRASTIAVARDAMGERRYDPAELVRKLDRRKADKIAKAPPARLATEIESGALRYITKGEIPTEDRDAHLRGLALYLLDKGHTVPDAIKTVGRANTRVAEPDRLADPAVIEMVKKAGADLTAARRCAFAAAITYPRFSESSPSPSGETAGVATAEEIVEEARRVLETDDPFEYMVQAFNKEHVGDEVLARCLVLSLGTRLVGNTRGLHVMATGASGTGKSDGFRAMLRQIPNQFKLKGAFSDKALFYKKDLAPCTIFTLDDRELSDGVQEVLKAATSDFRESIEYHTLTIDRQEQTCRIPERCLWWIAKVEGAGDDQVMNRMLLVWVDESAEQDRKVLERILDEAAQDPDEPIGEPHEVAVCRAVWDLLHTTGTVEVSLAKLGRRIRFNSARNRRNPIMFLDMVKSVALLRSRQREWRELQNGTIRVYATVDDFETAKGVFTALDGESGSQTHKLTQSEEDVIKVIVKAELVEFTLADLQRLTGLPHNTLYKRMKGYATRGQSHTGLLSKCPAISLVDRSEAEPSDQGTGAIRRRQDAYQFNQAVYNDWVNGAVVWLAPEDDTGRVDDPEALPSSGCCIVAASLLQSGVQDDQPDRHAVAPKGADPTENNDGDPIVASDAEDRSTPDGADIPTTGRPMDGNLAESVPASTPIRCSNLSPGTEDSAGNGEQRLRESLIGFCDVPQVAATVQQTSGIVLADINPADFVPLLDGHLLEPCAVCGSRAVHYKERYRAARRAGDGAQPIRICKTCFDTAKQREQAGVRTLPGSLPIDEIERLDPPRFGRCDICQLDQGIYRHHASSTKICANCYSALMRAQVDNR